jgi:hypothetical protein
MFCSELSPFEGPRRVVKGYRIVAGKVQQMYGHDPLECQAGILRLKLKDPCDWLPIFTHIHEKEAEGGSISSFDCTPHALVCFTCPVALLTVIAFCALVVYLWLLLGDD